MDAVLQLVADNLMGNGLQFIIENHHVVAVPPDRTAYVEKDLVNKGEDGADLVGNDFGRVEVARVQAQHFTAANRVTHVELVGTDHVRLRTEPKKLALDRIQIVLGIDGFGKHGIE